MFLVCIAHIFFLLKHDYFVDKFEKYLTSSFNNHTKNRKTFEWAPFTFALWTKWWSKSGDRKLINDWFPWCVNADVVSFPCHSIVYFLLASIRTVLFLYLLLTIIVKIWFIQFTLTKGELELKMLNVEFLPILGESHR